MKKREKKKRLAAVLGLCAALAAVPVPSAAGGSVSGQDGRYAVRCDGLTAGSDYTVTAVRGTLEDYVLNDSHILYTTQFRAASPEASLTFPVRQGENAVILLAGRISGTRSPEVIGLIENGAVSTHHYTVDFHDAACTEQGYRSYYCAHCGETIVRDVTEPKGHRYEVSGRVDAEENREGYVEYKCADCGDTYRETLPAEDNWNCPFTDVAKSSWYYTSVKYAFKNSLFNGVSDNTFAPDLSMTRAMLVTVLYRMEGTPSADLSSSAFTDVVSGSWYEAGVQWASSRGIVNGMGDGTFVPDGSVTREQMAAILCRYAGQKGADTAKSVSLSNFADSDSVSSWARDSMAWSCAAGLISGIESGQEMLLAPGGNATRAQVATVLMRCRRNVL